MNELMLWQQEGFGGMFAQEEACSLPPPSRRFLPYRDGEVDDNARTPRDGRDAEDLAPDDSIAVNRLGSMLRTQTASFGGSFGASEVMDSQAFDTGNTSNL